MKSLQKLSRFKLTLLVLAIGLAIFPFVSDSRTALIMLTQIFIFAVFAMSYDILLGYTGIVSFGHAMFFGIGAYTVAICLKMFGSTMPAFFVAIVLTLIFTGVVSYLVGILTLRLKSHFFAMLTLAVSSLFLVTAEKWRSLTMGNDGFTFVVPELFRDRVSFYLIALVLLVGTYIFLDRFTQSPMGKVLQAIRENEPRVESLGFKVMHYKVIANVVAGMVAGLAGILYAMSLRFVNTAVLSVELSLDVLLITIIGGVGTLFGSVVGAAIIELARHGLMDLAKVHWIFERWVILFGIIFILVVMFFPKGIVGTTKHWWDKRQYKKKEKLRKEMEAGAVKDTFS
ncbi:ABC transporter permease protein [Alkalihalophilus pseudofirmus OF4]|jgi:branched-chain amino acid transport system permease protein|uniref:ABC transporter permease protein n=2 Tax=Alkalihalophilus pseudofirmus TaxID=79885 RepID=D3FXL8_ALKPO|nr:branched-chain amino acid ABC transporter permease [Alkalihalophilus pseudofirmus]ADC48855.1 ABC transporter permease protein [Alkalihalophilus pseudofirmus OF4]MDV2885987.1 branched-chain amino acid ABC transporter permease [Alkalihalophilus pseudofirmus]